MLDTLSHFFNINQFIPHGHCFLWMPSLLWTLVASDGLIALSYYTIPVALMLAVGNRQNDRLKWIIWMFSAFIFACGTTHLIDIATIWYPNYWLDAGAKAFTAVISAVTAIAIWPIVKEARAYVDFQIETTERLSGTNTQLRASLENLRQQKADLHDISELSGLLHVCTDFNEMGTAFTETVAKIFPQSAGGLFLADENESDFPLISSWGLARQNVTIGSDKCWAYRLGRIFPDKQLETGLKCRVHGCGIDSDKYCLPVIGVGKTLALLQFEGIDYFSDKRAADVMTMLTERLGLALYNLHLKNSLEFRSTRDGLTGLFNRRYMDETLQTEINRAKRSGSEVSVMMFDIDDFKDINDTFGHDAGDKALRRFADVLRGNLREGDVACRYGGEEFVVILPGVTFENAVEKADMIRRKFMESVSQSPDLEFNELTVSGGVASHPRDGGNMETLLKQADKTLLAAKRSGKNRINTPDDV